MQEIWANAHETCESQ